MWPLEAEKDSEMGSFIKPLEGMQSCQHLNVRCFFFFLLYNIVLVLPYINMHPPNVRF